MPTEAQAPADWWGAPIKRFMEYINQERDLVVLSSASIEALKSQDAYSQTLEVAAASVSQAVTGSELVALAHAESNSDYRLFHGHSLVAIWGALETMVFDVVVAWLLNGPDATAHPKVAEMKVPFGLFEELSREERIYTVTSELDRQRGDRAGIQRFENVLDPVDLSGSYEGVLADNIYEMQQMRNVFAHRSGVADRRFADACPHLGYGVGDLVMVGQNTWTDFIVTAMAYASVIARRMRAKLGLPGQPATIPVTPIRHTLASGS
jgi:hypothetical protein